MLQEVIRRCCELKSAVVIGDERESGRRAILNYGHTFGHAIEAVFGYGKYLHGEAISIGMQAAGLLAEKLGMVDSEFVQRQSRLLTAFGLPVVLDTKDNVRQELVATMHNDKKSKSGVLRLVLPSRVGEVKIVASPGDELLLQAFEDVS